MPFHPDFEKKVKECGKSTAALVNELLKVSLKLTDQLAVVTDLFKQFTAPHNEIYALLNDCLTNHTDDLEYMRSTASIVRSKLVPIATTIMAKCDENNSGEVSQIQTTESLSKLFNDTNKNIVSTLNDCLKYSGVTPEIIKTLQEKQKAQYEDILQKITKEHNHSLKIRDTKNELLIKLGALTKLSRMLDERISKKSLADQNAAETTSNDSDSEHADGPIEKNSPRQSAGGTPPKGTSPALSAATTDSSNNSSRVSTPPKIVLGGGASQGCLEHKESVGAAARHFGGSMAFMAPSKEEAVAVRVNAPNVSQGLSVEQAVAIVQETKKIEDAIASHEKLLGIAFNSLASNKLLADKINMLSKEASGFLDVVKKTFQPLNEFIVKGGAVINKQKSRLMMLDDPNKVAEAKAIDLRSELNHLLKLKKEIDTMDFTNLPGKEKIESFKKSPALTGGNGESFKLITECMDGLNYCIARLHIAKNHVLSFTTLLQQQGKEYSAKVKLVSEKNVQQNALTKPLSSALPTIQCIYSANSSSKAVPAEQLILQEKVSRAAAHCHNV